MKRLITAQFIPGSDILLDSFKIAEKFVSINGEGTHSGQLAVFIRFAGCNLSCSYCDTKWANEEKQIFDIMTSAQIEDFIIAQGIKNVTLTGGEPLIQPGIINLIERLSYHSDLYIEIETNGSVDIREADRISIRPSLTMDYKLPSSGMTEYMNKDNFNFLKKCDTVKFVAGTIKDLETAYKIIREYDLNEKCSVYLSPVYGMIEPAVIVRFMTEKKLNNVNLQLQIHKIIWDPEKKGV